MKKKKKTGNTLARPEKADVGLLIVLGLLALITLFPFYHVLVLSVSTTASYAKHPLYLLPYEFDLTGYKTIFSDPQFFRALGNTLFVTIVGTAINMFLTVTGAYVLSRKHLIGRKFFLVAILFTMLFGGGLIPGYLLMKDLHLINTRWAMVLPCAIDTYYMILMKNSFEAIPDSLLEAAKIDGANEITVLTRIVLPVSKPTLATYGLFYAVARWNEWYLSNLYNNKLALQPLQMYLRDVLVTTSSTLNDIARQFAMQDKVSTVTVRMATIVVTMIPIICVYPFVQKYFVKGVMVGSVKE